MNNKKTTFIRRLLQGYHILVLKESSLEERLSARLTGIKMLSLLMLVGLFFCLATLIVIQYSPLKSYLFRVQTDSSKREVLQMFQKIDSLEEQLHLLEQYTHTLQPILLKDVNNLTKKIPKINQLQVNITPGEKKEISNLSNYKESDLLKKVKILERQLQLKDLQINDLNGKIATRNSNAMMISVEQDLDTILEQHLGNTANEISFRKEIESQYKFNLFDFEIKNTPLLLATPIQGSIIQPYSNEKNHWGIIIKTTSNPVKAVLDGRIILTNWHPQHGNTVLISHQGQYLSIYKNIQNLYVKTGDWVTKGEAIATLDNDKNKESAFMFELWKDQYPIDPLKYLDFK